MCVHRTFAPVFIILIHARPSSSSLYNPAQPNSACLGIWAFIYVTWPRTYTFTALMEVLSQFLCDFLPKDFIRLNFIIQAVYLA